MTFTTDAIVLTYILYRDHDRIYTVYTRDYGKMVLLARGANKIVSKLAGNMEIGALSRIMIASGKGFDILAQACAAQPFVAVRLNAEKLIVACALIEALDKLTEARHEDPSVFHLLESALFKLSQSAQTNDSNFLYQYLLRLLILLGHAPNMKDERVLQTILVADIGEDGILVKEEARLVIDAYARHALDEKQLYCFGLANRPIRSL